MQPVQDLTIEARVSRTQYQFTVESVDSKLLGTWVHTLVDRLKEAPQLADVASDLSDGGLAAYVEFDRVTASRLGITPAVIDNALYNAFGQRLVSTIFTQSNQYRVVLEVKPGIPARPVGVERCLRDVDGRRTDAAASAAFVDRTRRRAGLTAVDQPHRPVSGVDDSFNLAPGASLGDAVQAIETAKRELALPDSVQINFQGAALAFRASLEQRAVADPGRDRHHVHRSGRSLRKFHSPDHDPVHPALRWRGRAAGTDRLTGNDLSVIAIIGIILLHRYREERTRS